MDSLSLRQETLAPTVTTWRFEKVHVLDSDQFIVRIPSFFQSGMWNKWNLRTKTYNDTVLVAKSNKTIVKSLSVHDNVMVVFHLWIFLLSIDCVVFGKEVFVDFFMKIWQSRNSIIINTDIVTINILGSVYQENDEKL